MARILAALIVGMLLGIVAMLAITRFGPSINQSPNEIVRDFVDVPKMAPTVAEKHRDEQYANLTSVEEVTWLFADRKLKAQINADGRIFVLTQDQSPPIAAMASQPRGFPLVPDTA